MKQYLDILQKIKDYGFEKGDRTGTGTTSTFGVFFEHDMKNGFPLLTTKKMFTKGIITELLWIMKGQTNIRPLVLEDNNIWVGDAYKRYENALNSLGSGVSVFLTRSQFISEIKNNEAFAEKWGELGPIYGKQWRDWGDIDQLNDAIEKLRHNPDDRRNIVNAWNVPDIPKAVLPPCHNMFQFYTRELSFNDRVKLTAHKKSKMSAISEKDFETYNIPKRAVSLMWNQRSIDTPLGLPFNIASYAFLLEFAGRMANMKTESLKGSLGDTHIYSNQWEGVEEQLTRTPLKLPTVSFSDHIDFTKSLDEVLAQITYKDFHIHDYESLPEIKFPLSN